MPLDFGACILCNLSILVAFPSKSLCRRSEGLPAGCVCVAAACGASETSGKTHSGKTRPLEFYSMYLAYFIDLIVVCSIWVVFLLVLGTLNRVRRCGGCLWRFVDLRKNTPLECWSMCLAYFCCYCQLSVPYQRACGALAPSEKHDPGFGEYLPCVCF